jgi:integrase
MTLPSYERLAGTGARVTEARSLRWEDVDANQAGVLLRGTKSRSSRRHVSFNTDLAEWMRRRHERSGGKGYVFASPYFTGESRTKGRDSLSRPSRRSACVSSPTVRRLWQLCSWEPASPGPRLTVCAARLQRSPTWEARR